MHFHLHLFQLILSLFIDQSNGPLISQSIPSAPIPSKQELKKSLENQLTVFVKLTESLPVRNKLKRLCIHLLKQNQFDEDFKSLYYELLQVKVLDFDITSPISDNAKVKFGMTLQTISYILYLMTN